MIYSARNDTSHLGESSSCFVEQVNHFVMTQWNAHKPADMWTLENQKEGTEYTINSICSTGQCHNMPFITLQCKHHQSWLQQGEALITRKHYVIIKLGIVATSNWQTSCLPWVNWSEYKARLVWWYDQVDIWGQASKWWTMNEEHASS